jgi:hypothetical protein
MLTNRDSNQSYSWGRSVRIRTIRMIVFCGLFSLAGLLGACSGAKTGTVVGQGQNISQGESSAPEHSGPFSAVATSAISVNLAWDPVEGASGYRVENQFGDSEWFVLAELGADATSYEAFLAPSDMELNYRLTPLTGETEVKALNASVTTPPVVPNPYSVVATIEQPDYSNLGLNIPGFDPNTFDPSTFDPSTLDLSALDSENFDPASLMPVSVSSLAYIGPEGGNLSVTGKNDVVYTLEVPPGALSFTTSFVLTPVADIQGYPFSGGWSAAVSIQPEGIYFEIPAKLTIELSDDVLANQLSDPGLQEIAFGYELNGEEFYIKSFSQDTTPTAQKIFSSGTKVASPLHQSGGGNSISVSWTQSFGSGLGKALELLGFSSEHPTDSPSRNAEQNDAARKAAQDDDLAPLDYAGVEVGSLLERIKQAKDAVDFEVLVLADFRVLFDTSGYGSLDEGLKEELWNKMLDRAIEFLQPEDCPSPQAGAVQDLVRKLQNPPDGFYKEFTVRLFVKLGEEKAKNLLNAIDAAQGCKLKLVISSTAIEDNRTDCRVQAVVRAEIPLHWVFDDKPFLQGSGPIKYLQQPGTETFDTPIKFEILTKPNVGDEWCTKYEYSNSNPSTFEVIRLYPIFDGKKLTDWKLERYDGGGQAVKICIATERKDGDGSSNCQEVDPAQRREWWVGTVNLSYLEKQDQQGGLGLHDWRLEGLDAGDTAKWEGQSQYTDMASYHSSDTTLWLRETKGE